VAELLVGVDVGTTYCKALVLDAEGGELAVARVRTPWKPVPTGAEVDPRALARAAHAAVAEALADSPAGVVATVGIAGMAETGVLLDAHGGPVTPAIAWHDARGSDEALGIAADLGRREFAMRTGLPVSALCSLSKLRWQRSHVAGVESAVRWLGVPEWVARSLGAADVAELSLASRTGMFCLRERTWWPDALAWLGVAEGLMAEPVPAGTPVGRVGDALPAARGAVIAIGGHDHLVAMLGAGATAEGDVLHSSGTSEVFVRTIPAQLEPARVADAVRAGVTVGCHVIPERWALLSGDVLSVGPASVLQSLGIDGEAARDALDAAAAQLGPADRPPLEGSGATAPPTPYGGAPGASPARVWRAALEAGADVSAATLARSDAVGGPRRRIVATGGGARGAATRAIKEERLGPIEWSPVQEATGRGAALLGGIAAGLYASVDDLPRPPGEASAQAREEPPGRRGALSG
jgi:sugar (pentulose or hexulose) kinase